MLGYHDSDRCIFDLWSPVDDQCDGLDTIYTHPHAAPGWPTARENRAFSPYAKHTQETEDIINEIVRRGRMGDTNFTLDLDDDFSDDELEYIKQEVQRRL